MALSSLTPASSSSIEVFRQFPVEIAIESMIYKECRQSGNVALTNQIDIPLESKGKQMINLDESTLNLRFRVEGAGGAEVEPVEYAADNKTVVNAPTPVTVVNNIIHSMWEGVQMSLNMTNVYSSRAHAFSHKNFLKILRSLQFQQVSKEEQMFHLDYPPMLSKSCAIRGGNQGVYARNQRILHKKSVHVCGPLGLGIATTKTLLPPAISGKLTLIKASDDYIILTDKEGEAKTFKIIIEDVWVKLCLVTLPQSVLDGLLNNLTKMPATYLYQESEVKEISFHANNRLPTAQEICSGFMPYEMVLIMVSQNSHQGAKTSNPFVYEVRFIH